MNRDFFLDIIKRKKRAYNACFHLTGSGEQLSQSGVIVLSDIVEFCKPYASTHVSGRDGMIDPIAAAVREGQRSVYLHLLKQLHLDDSEIIKATQQLEKGELGYE